MLLITIVNVFLCFIYYNKKANIYSTFTSCIENIAKVEDDKVEVFDIIIYKKFINYDYGSFEIMEISIIVSNCVDINECSQGTSRCSQLCTNTIGSYNCTCHNGYQLGNDNHTCTDINECNTNNGGCDHNCINTQGSYQCQCREGYETNNNGINCTGMTKF